MNISINMLVDSFQTGEHLPSLHNALMILQLKPRKPPTKCVSDNLTDKF